ncbi:MAG: hypothetical protein RMI79_00330 [Nitrososphaerota archaeon]|nr:hypothetical protein [Nitrososphaerota archaeon]
MKIRVEFVGQFREIVGVSEILVELDENKTLYDLILVMASKYGKEFKKRIFVEDTKKNF